MGKLLKYLLVAEDHPICTVAIDMAAHAYESAIVVTGVQTLDAAKDQLEARRFDGMVLDLGLKDSQGFINLSIVHSIAPRMPILVVSATEQPDAAAKARSLGARGFLPKSAPMDEMTSAIAAVLNGGEWFEDGLDNDAELESDQIKLLSGAQLRVMREVAKGQPNKIIAADLGLAEQTVKTHVSAALKTLGVTNRSQAILRLKEMGVTE